MKTQSVLILGAGLMQVPAIKAANKNGYKTFVIDANPNAHAVPLADSFKKIDLKDMDGILKFASELKSHENLKAVFTAGTDFSASVSYVCGKLGFCSHSFESALNASIKPRMRSCFEKAGVPSPEFFSFSRSAEKDELLYTEERAYEAVRKLGFPCVVKPADNMGARGCRMIRSETEVSAALAAAVENSRTGTIILEKYMEGPEFSIDAIIYDGTMTVTGFADRHIYYPPYFIETGHTMPSCADERTRNELISVFALGVKALGLTCGAAKADIKYTENGPEIGEIAARLSGGYMSGWTFPYSSSLDLTEQALLVACGRKPERMLKMRRPVEFSLPKTYPDKNSVSIPFELFQIKSGKTSAERAWISIPGKIAGISGLKNRAGHFFTGGMCIKNVFPRPVRAGMEIDFPRNNVQKCGNVISKSSDRRRAVLSAESVCSGILVRLEPYNKKTDDFLAGMYEQDETGFPPASYESYFKVRNMDLSGTIPAGKPVLRNVPREILPLLDLNQKDWNYLTARQTAARFDTICRNHSEIPQKAFWMALFKGGLQAAVYVSDCYSENKHGR